MSDQKKCFKCGEVKPLAYFYKHPQMPDGHVNKCKECNKRDVRENRAKKVDYYREYDRQRFKNDPRVRERNEKYYAKWIKRSPIKRGASVMVNNAVQSGRLIKPKTCEECGSTHKFLHGHHDDYAKPLDVRWLCPPCHKAWHDQNGEGLNAY